MRWSKTSELIQLAYGRKTQPNQLVTKQKIINSELNQLLYNQQRQFNQLVTKTIQKFIQRHPRTFESFLLFIFIKNFPHCKSRMNSTVIHLNNLTNVNINAL